MAEQVVNSVTVAVTGELTSRVFSRLIHRYGEDSATSEKLQRLEMLLIKIHSAIEASEKRTLENLWLLRWRDKLKEAASKGDEVLARFLQQARDAQAISGADANQQQGEAAPSSGAAPVTAVCAQSFKRNPLSSITRSIRNASKMLFVRADDDMERLNKILSRLEKLSPDIGEFIRLLHLEALPKVVRLHEPMKKMRRMRSNTNMRRTTHSDPSSTPSLFSISPPTEENAEVVARDFCLSNTKEDNTKRVAREFCLSRTKEEKTKRVAREFCLPWIDELDELALVIDLERDSPVLRKEQQHTLLQNRLLAASATICEAVDLAGSCGLEGLEWLEYWTSILREAKQQGCAVLCAVSARKTINTEDNKLMVEFDQETDELGGFVHRLEGLVSDVEHFKELVNLQCRWACSSHVVIG